MTWHFSQHPKTTQTTKGVPTTIFNVVLDCDAGMFAFTGFRLIDGRIIPPAVKVKVGGGGGRYVDTVLLDGALLGKMAQALRAQGFPVAEKDEDAVGGVLTQDRVARVLQ